MLDIYPPPTIRLIGAAPSLIPLIPWTSWECSGYNANTWETPTEVALEADRRLAVDVALKDDASLTVRIEGQETSPLPGEMFVLPPGEIDLLIRLCTGDGRCATYSAITSG